MEKLRIVWLLDEVESSSSAHTSALSIAAASAKGKGESEDKDKGKGKKGGKGKGAGTGKKTEAETDQLAAVLSKSIVFPDPDEEEEEEDEEEEEEEDADDDEAEDSEERQRSRNMRARKSATPGILPALLGSHRAAAHFKQHCFMGGKENLHASSSSSSSSGNSLNPVVVRGSERRVSHLVKRFMHGLQVPALLEASASELIQVWVRNTAATATATGAKNKTQGKKRIREACEEEGEGELSGAGAGAGFNGLARTCKVDSSEALEHYKRGNSLYCRAPAALEHVTIKPLLSELGFGISPFANSSSDRHSRGEIETFFSRAGHVTDTHTDFQENFTVQLTGELVVCVCF